MPSKERTIYPKIMTKKEYDYLKERNRVMTKEERQAAEEAAEEERERLTKESMERKEAMRRMDSKKCRDKDPKMTEIEEEARKRTMHILNRAQNMRLEQEEEIQKCNRFILETKCRTIRDAQVNADRFFGSYDFIRTRLPAVQSAVSRLRRSRRRN